MLYENFTRIIKAVDLLRLFEFSVNLVMHELV